MMMIVQVHQERENKEPEDIAFEQNMSTMGKRADDQSYVINMMAKNTKISDTICKAGYIKSDESQFSTAQNAQQERLLEIVLQTEKTKVV